MTNRQTDIAIIGAGPQALTLVTHLLQKKAKLRQRIQVFDEQIWHQIPNHFSSIALDAAVIMPNHFHRIIVISSDVPVIERNLNTTFQKQAKKPKLEQVVAYFKYQSTKCNNSIRGTPGMKLWQRNYYEHVIRSEASLERLRDYIARNPEQWKSDQLHPENPSKW